MSAKTTSASLKRQAPSTRDLRVEGSRVQASYPGTILNAEHRYTPSADGTRIHYYPVGEGEPVLVCCDGIGCDGYIWKYVVRDLAPEMEVVRWHYRAHGSSEVPQDPSRIRIDDLCDDLLAVIDALGQRKVVLLGHSMGVQVILEFHRRYPDRVHALVPICGSYGRPLDTFHDNPLLKFAFPYLHRAVKRLGDVAQTVWNTVVDTELAYQVATHTEVNGDLIRREDFRAYFNHLASMDIRHFLGLLEDASRHDTLDHLGDIEVPTLIIAGEKDTFTPPWLSSVMHARIPESELCFVPGGTHAAPIEVPELVTLRLRRFLEQRVLPALESAKAKSEGKRATTS